MTKAGQCLEMETATVADVAMQFPQSIAILNQYNLDYCCNGRKSFVQTCHKARLNPETVWKEVLDRQRNSPQDHHLNIESWEPSLLIYFIVQHHHKYVRESIPPIETLLNKVCGVHGQVHPELFSIKNDFNALAEELLQHMSKEENALFPAIKSIGADVEAAHFINLESPISVMEHEHEAAGKLVKSIRSLSANYTAPTNACMSFQLTYMLLQEFENDLMQHIHLENNILFPKALRLVSQ